MNSFMIGALAILAGVLPCAAQPTASFEAALGAARVTLGELRHEQLAVGAKSLATDIDRAESWARQLRNFASRLRWAVRDVANRARRNPRDQFLASDVRRVAWAARDLRYDVESLERDMRNLASGATKDPELVGPAQRLESELGWLKSETGWLQSEGMWAGMDIRRAGYSLEAWDIERETRSADDSARQSQGAANRLVAKVSGQALKKKLAKKH